MSLDYTVTCECGNEIEVAKGQCGTLVDCRYECGRRIFVPRLSELQPREPTQHTKVIAPVDLVRVPAIALLIAAMTAIIASIACLFSASSLLRLAKLPVDELFVVFCFVLVSVIAVNCFVAFGALQMSRLRQHGVALAASILSLVFGFSLIGLIAGLWALSVLHKKSVRKAFGL